jgi:hypothetical protein
MFFAANPCFCGVLIAQLRNSDQTQLRDPDRGLPWAFESSMAWPEKWFPASSEEPLRNAVEVGQHRVVPSRNDHGMWGTCCSVAGVFRRLAHSKNVGD